MALRRSYFERPSDSEVVPIFQLDLLCNGSEADLLECGYFMNAARECPDDHSEDAAVLCNGIYNYA